MDIIDFGFHLFFLILGIILIVGTGLVILRYKRKYPEKELDYKTSLNICLFGIFLIIMGITGPLGFAMFAILFYLYDKRKHPETYKYLHVNVWEKILLLIALVLVILIIVLCLITN
jgi:hypothetical protein